jgi:hypothetical protein
MSKFRVTLDQAIALLMQNIQQSVLTEPLCRVIEGVLYGMCTPRVVDLSDHQAHT